MIFPVVPCRSIWWVVALALVLATGRAQERLPPVPPNHFNDYARAVSPAVARTLNERLERFERDTSTQLVVAIFPRLDSASSVEDYTVRVAEAWAVGTRERRNGAVLFAFMEQRQLYLQVGYGLEGVLPDALSKRIIEDEMIPRMRAGDTDGAFSAGVEAMLAAARGEYTGTGRTVAQGRGRPGGGGGVGVLIFVIILMTVLRRMRRGTMYHRRGRRTIWMGPGPWMGGGGRGFGGGGFGGGGTFSGGGGSFGGGGAGGRW